MAETLSAKTSQALGITDPIKDLTTKRDTAMQEELVAGEKIQALETKKLEAEAKRTSEQAQEKVKSTEELTQRQTEREAPIREQKSVIDKALMNEHFAPSKQNLQDQAALFSLINVIGFAIGTGGKQNAVQAMYAMNGMLEGHQKGRADLFKQEQVKFDKNFKALQQKATFLETELRHSLEEFTRDKRAADERASAAFAAAGADFMKIYAEKNGLVAAYERAKEVRKSLDKAVEGERQRKQRIEDKIDAEERANKDRIAAEERRLRDQIKLQRLRQEDRLGLPTLKGSGKGGAVQFRYNQAMTNAGNQLANEIENAASLPISATPPVLAEVLTDPSKGLSEAGKRFFAQKITDEDARAFQQVFAGMTRAITTIEASGRPSGATEGAIREFAKSQPRAGDKKINIYLSLAQSKQVMDILVKDLKAAEANSVQIAQAEEAKERVNNIITWTVRDVNRIISSGKSTLIDPKVRDAMGTSQTLSDFNKQVKPGVSKQYPTEADAEKAFKAGTLKAGEKVNIGGVSGTWE